MTQAIDELLGEVTSAVSASTEQTTASQALAQEVAGKMGAIDAKVAEAKLELDGYIADSEVIGDGSAGSRRLNVFRTMIYEGKDHVPESEKPDNWVPTNGPLYLHFKTGLNTAVDVSMFHYRIGGYAYGQSTIIDETLVGYSYEPSNTIHNINTDGNLEPVVYRAPNGDVYLRIKSLNLYFTGLYIDAMHITGGLPDKDSIELTISPNETLNNY
ncbi:hypothetical protein GCM10007978_19780 [Shewanella hanedai]|uniref:Uncharacterized protein n=1 Tax=Shewanella hanedai TaxID=25 RepID=A0A553JM92_SHEHA|nr:hypothetical protein [Shewanella hanedai]TRY13567.1 hypothetical protein FN961_15125 [Shewanella hanedai]GGI82045.1 hypothetical protein GCM10007978_19780 [Shewanella hanedai]